MAEIKVEKKNKNGGNNSKLIWIVVLFLFALVALIWWIGTDDEDRDVEDAGVVEQRISVKAPLQQGPFEGFPPYYQYHEKGIKRYS